MLAPFLLPLFAGALYRELPLPKPVITECNTERVVQEVQAGKFVAGIYYQQYSQNNAKARRPGSGTSRAKCDPQVRPSA